MPPFDALTFSLALRWPFDAPRRGGFD